jgi:chemotaxis protein methyltransferase CheR
MPWSVPENASLFLLSSQQSSPNAVYTFQAGPSGGWRSDCPDPLARNGSLRRHQLAATLSQTILGEEPSFFDDQGSLDALVDLVLPTLVPSRRYTQALRLWSVGYRTGHETYSLAMTIAESYPQLSRWNLEVVASGADEAALARAQCGVYSSREVERGLSVELVTRYFEQDSIDGGWRFKNRATAPIIWLPNDRLQRSALVGVVDVTVCHRPLRELDPKGRRDLLGRLTNQIASDGFLILPSSDSEYGPEDGFERVGGRQAVYRRVRRENSLLSA